MKIDITGETYGDLEVVSLAGYKARSDGRKRSMWNCKCKCGRSLVCRTDVIRRKGHRSCGKCNYKVGPESHAWKGYKLVQGSYFSRIKRSAKKRGYSFTISIEDVYNKFKEQGYRCALSNRELTFGLRKADETTASVDRIDNSRGYEKDNIQIIHKDINAMRNKFDMDYFIDVCREITEFKGVS